jgi:hypothetical protein
LSGQGPALGVFVLRGAGPTDFRTKITNFKVGKAVPLAFAVSEKRKSCKIVSEKRAFPENGCRMKAKNLIFMNNQGTEQPRGEAQGEATRTTELGVNQGKSRWNQAGFKVDSR